MYAIATPTLQGTEKQITWASKIVAEQIAASSHIVRMLNSPIKGGFSSEQVAVFEAAIKEAQQLVTDYFANPSAAFWIDNRNITHFAILEPKVKAILMAAYKK